MAAEQLPAARFRLAPVVDGAVAWDRATALVIAPIRLTTRTITKPPPGVLVVTDWGAR